MTKTGRAIFPPEDYNTHSAGEFGNFRPFPVPSAGFDNSHARCSSTVFDARAAGRFGITWLSGFGAYKSRRNSLSSSDDGHVRIEHSAGRMTRARTRRRVRYTPRTFCSSNPFHLYTRTRNNGTPYKSVCVCVTLGITASHFLRTRVPPPTVQSVSC